MKYRMVLKFDGGEERVYEGQYPAAPSSAVLVEALRPFANYHDAYLAEDRAPGAKLVFSGLTLSDFRRASKIVADA